VAIDKVRAYMRDVRRIGYDVLLRAIMPHWILDLMRADLARAMHTSNEAYLGLNDDVIMGWFRNRGVIPTFTLDGRAAQSASGSGPTRVVAMSAQAYSALTGSNTTPGFPDQVEMAIFPEGAFFYLDGGSLDIGIVRDQSLVQTNRFIQFSETFEGVARKGVEAVRLVATLQPTGASAGTINTSAFGD
jgi:hypothetical protein